VPPKQINVHGRMWDRTLMMTRQPRFADDTVVTARERAPEGDTPSATEMGIRF